jgi:hypothetical protein
MPVICHIWMTQTLNESLLVTSDFVPALTPFEIWWHFLLMTYRGADKSLARPTSRCILFDGENTSFDGSLVIYINSTNIPPITIINRIYENQNLVSLYLVSFLVGLRTYQQPCIWCVSMRYSNIQAFILSVSWLLFSWGIIWWNMIANLTVVVKIDWVMGLSLLLT